MDRERVALDAILYAAVFALLVFLGSYQARKNRPNKRITILPVVLVRRINAKETGRVVVGNSPHDRSLYVRLIRETRLEGEVYPSAVDCG
jgi:hypothetical protein